MTRNLGYFTPERQGTTNLISKTEGFPCFDCQYNQSETTNPVSLRCYAGRIRTFTRSANVEVPN
jgi:hypothetical protein